MNNESVADRFAREAAEAEHRWLEEVVVAHTPRWAHLIAIASQYKGMRWLSRSIVPLVRRFAQVSVTTETKIDRPPKGFRNTSVLQSQTHKVYKRGRLVAERTFPAVVITNSALNKLL